MPWFRRALSLRARITASFTLIVVGGTVVSTLIGSRIITTALLSQAQARARQGLDAARMTCAERLDAVTRSVGLAGGLASGADLAHPSPRVLERLAALRHEGDLDFLSVTDRTGAVVHAGAAESTTRSGPLPPLVGRALGGAAASGFEVLSAEMLAAEDRGLAERARLALAGTVEPDGHPGAISEGLVLLATVPVRTAGGAAGVAYGGVLLNRSDAIVDRVKRLVFGREMYRGREVGTVSIFLHDMRVSTNVMTQDGHRAVGTRVSAPVADAVLARGEPWSGRAFVVNDWYVTAYDPVRDASGAIVGILYAGILEAPFLAARTEVMLSFLVVCVVGLAIVFALTYLLTRTTIRPLEAMVAATREIASGNLDVRVAVTSRDEIGALAASFNDMLAGLQTMRTELEGWARTLEVKVQERTDELVAVQSRMAQSEKLASIGRLAAGVAHGINNPLGGILAITMLALEDCDEQHPLRGDLETIVKQTLRCREIVKGLLDFSHQSEGRASRLNVNAIVDSTISLLERQAMFHNIRTVRDLCPDLPPVLVDPGQMQEVIINIVLNAVDAMEENGVLTVATAFDPIRAEVTIRIGDTGKGIPPEVLPLVFEPFFTTKRVGKGTGLGLAIVHGIVTRAHGSVDVTSEPGRTTFTVKLPAAPEDVEDDAVETAGRVVGQSAAGG